MAVEHVTHPPEVETLLREINELFKRAEAIGPETERAVQEHIREEWQTPQPLARAFKLMLFETCVHEKLGIPAEKIDWYKQHCRRGGYIAAEEMEGLLRKSGWENGVAGWWKQN